MKLSIVFIANAIFAAFGGLSLLLAPQQTFSAYGATLDPGGVFVARKWRHLGGILRRRDPHCSPLPDTPSIAAGCFCVRLTRGRADLTLRALWPFAYFSLGSSGTAPEKCVVAAKSALV